MNISEANRIVRSLYAGADIEPKFAVQALHVLERECGDAGADIADAAFTAYPGLLNYDEKGNWIGNVANENGWTA
jgi:hypothetical protein